MYFSQFIGVAFALSADTRVYATVAKGLEPSWSYGTSAQEDELDRLNIDC